MTKKYKTIVTDAYMIMENDVYEWATDIDKTVAPFESKTVEEHNTVQKALESASNWGSKWAMYSGLIIEDQEGSEVYSDIPAVIKCKCCKKEDWTRLTSDLRAIKNKEGKVLFPEIV